MDWEKPLPGPPSLLCTYSPGQELQPMWSWVLRDESETYAVQWEPGADPVVWRQDLARQHFKLVRSQKHLIKALAHFCRVLSQIPTEPLPGKTSES